MPQQETAKQPIKSANTQSLEPFARPLEGHRPAPAVSPTPPPSLSHATVQRALANPRALSPNDILQLQRTAGNQAVLRMITPVQNQPTSPQTLTISTPSKANAQPRIQRKRGKKQALGSEQDGSLQENEDRSDFSLRPTARHYLEDGGTRRWMKDVGSFPSKYLQGIDVPLRLYRQYKSKNRGNAEEQLDLLMHIQRELANSRYQTNFKDTSTFRKRELATTRLKNEVDQELATNAKRLVNVASQNDKAKELLRIGFTKDFLRDLNGTDLDLLYAGHVYLTYQQMGPAQAAFDALNPVQRDEGKFKYNDNKYIERTRGDLLVAQQMVISHHHAAIGGAYARAFKHEPMGKHELKKVKKDYLRNKDFIGEGNLDFVKNKGKKTLQEVVQDNSNLSKPELEAIRVYTTSKYKELNATMHDYRLDNSQEQRGFEGFSSINQLLMSALSKLPPYTGGPLMRGDFDFSGLTNTLRPGTIYQTPSVLSTTKNAQPPWGNIWWRINVASNSRGRDVENISVALGEGEVLFPPGTKFKIIDILKRQTADPFGLGPNPDPDGFRREGETTEDWVRRIYKSESKQKISNSTMSYLIKYINACSNLILVQEI